MVSRCIFPERVPSQIGGSRADIPWYFPIFPQLIWRMPANQRGNHYWPCWSMLVTDPKRTMVLFGRPPHCNISRNRSVISPSISSSILIDLAQSPTQYAREALVTDDECERSLFVRWQDVFRCGADGAGFVSRVEWAGHVLMNTTVDVAAGCQEEVLFVVLMVKVAVYRLLCVCGGACVPPNPNINSHYLT